MSAVDAFSCGSGVDLTPVVCIGVVDIELLFCNLVDPNCAPSASHDCCAVVVGCEIGWDGAAAVCCSRQGKQANDKDINLNLDVEHSY